MDGRPEKLLPPSLPEVLTLIRLVLPAVTSRRKTLLWVVGVPTRSVAKLWKAMRLPSPLMWGSLEALSPPALPELLTLTSVVVPETRSRTKMFWPELVGVPTKSLAELRKATKRPSALITAESENELPA